MGVARPEDNRRQQPYPGLRDGSKDSRDGPDPARRARSGAARASCCLRRRRTPRLAARRDVRVAQEPRLSPAVVRHRLGRIRPVGPADRRKLAGVHHHRLCAATGRGVVRQRDPGADPRAVRRVAGGSLLATDDHRCLQRGGRVAGRDTRGAGDHGHRGALARLRVRADLGADDDGEPARPAGLRQRRFDTRDIGQRDRDELDRTERIEVDRPAADRRHRRVERRSSSSPRRAVSRR
jgi:hypothetical protein